MEMTLLVVIEKTGWNSRNNKTSSDQKNVEYIYLKNSCFRQDFGPDKQGIFRGMEQSPDQRGTSNSDEGLKKRGTIVVITPARTSGYHSNVG
jgi:hypothetical protein